MNRFEAKLAAALNLSPARPAARPGRAIKEELEDDLAPAEPAPVAGGWKNPGYEVELTTGDGDELPEDARGNPAICRWEIKDIYAENGEESYGGECETFQEMADHIRDVVIPSLRSNAIHGFKIVPAENQDFYDLDREPESSGEAGSPRDVGHDVQFNDDGGGMTDQNGNFGVFHWEFVTYMADGQAKYGGDVDHLDEVEPLVADIIDAMKQNLIHGFGMLPAADQA